MQKSQKAEQIIAEARLLAKELFQLSQVSYETMSDLEFALRVEDIAGKLMDILGEDPRR